MRARGLGAAFLAIAAVIHAGPANADGYRPARAFNYAASLAPTSYDWSGFYIGGHAGGAYASSEWLYNGTAFSAEESTGSFAGGAHAGLQKQWSRIVLGVDVAYTWADLEKTSAAPLLANTSLASSVSDLVLVTGKVGYTWDNLLASVRAGYASAVVDYSTSVAGVTTTSSSEREGGWTAALGLEYAVLPNVILGVEYDYVRINVGGRDQAAGGQISDGGVDIQTVLARLSFKFGPRAEPIPTISK